MKIGVCRVRLRLHGQSSLKGKRQVVKSLVARVQNRFNVSVAEVEDHDLWQLATLGISCVSNSAAHADEVLATVVAFIRTGPFDAELLDYEIEMVDVL